jgi:hypothetical protein
MDRDQAILWIHLAGDVPHPALIPTGRFGDAGNRMDIMNLVGWCHSQAAAAVTLGVRRLQFHDRNSVSRCAGYVTIRDRTSGSDA